MVKTSSYPKILLIFILIVSIAVGLGASPETKPEFSPKTSDSGSDLDVIGEKQWAVTWGGDYWDKSRSMWSDDESLYICGNYENPDNDHNILLVKADLEGNQIWNRTWDQGSEHPWAVWGDGSFIYVCGEARSISGTALIVKWDTEGNEIWSRTLSGENTEIFYAITGNTTSIFAAGYYYTEAAKAEIIITKWDADGTLLWQKSRGGDSYDAVKDMFWDGTHLYICGYSDDEVYYAKWDADGNEIWSKSWNHDRDVDYGCNLYCDANFVYISGYYGALNGGGGGFLLKWDKNGNLIWDVVKEGYTFRTMFVNSSEIFIGGIYEQGIFLSRWDTEGELLWIKELENNEANPSNIESMWVTNQTIFTVGDIEYLISNEPFEVSYDWQIMAWKEVPYDGPGVPQPQTISGWPPFFLVCMGVSIIWISMIYYQKRKYL